jgi:hypothetical protein
MVCTRLAVWPLKLAFLFLDMFSLTIMYCVLFCFIRIRSRKLVNVSTTATSEHEATRELQTWQVSTETGEDVQYTTSSNFFKMKSTTVAMEDGPTQSNRTRSSRFPADRRMNRVSRTLLCYPIIYIILTMPIAVSRLCEFAGKNWSLISVYIGGCLFMSSGFFNVLLYTTTRKGIISWRWFLRKPKHGRAPTNVSLYHPGSNPSQLAASTIHMPPSKPSVGSLSHPADCPHNEYDSVSSIDVQKQDYTAPDRISTTKHLW